MSIPVGQDSGPIATVARDFEVAKQEWDFPRGKQNRFLFHNELWELNKKAYDENIEKYDCCNIGKGGALKGIECAFKRVYGETSNGVHFYGAPHGGRTGNGFIDRTSSGQR